MGKMGKARWQSVLKAFSYCFLAFLSIGGVLNLVQQAYLFQTIYHKTIFAFVADSRVNKTDNDTFIADDGCGQIGELKSASWVPFTDAYMNYYRDFDECLRRLDKPHSNENISNLRMLQCDLATTNHDAREILQTYDTIHFIGDSVLWQQFNGFLCMMDTNLSKDHINVTGMHSSFTFNSTDGKTTHMIMDKSGYNFDMRERALYREIFPQAIERMSAKDAVVINGGVHYRSANAAAMRRALTFMAEQSLRTNASVFFVEPTAEEWPTSNGFFTMACMWKCVCEPMDPDRMRGHGRLSDKRANYTDDIGRADRMLDKGVMDLLYPDQSQAIVNSSSSPSCIPDCNPPRWRVDLARNIFHNRTKNRVQTVPVWWQLVSLGAATPRNDGDCTHKSSNAIMMMNHQLIRAMIQSKQDSSLS